MGSTELRFGEGSVLVRLVTFDVTFNSARCGVERYEKYSEWRGTVFVLWNNFKSVRDALGVPLSFTDPGRLVICALCLNYVNDP